MTKKVQARMSTEVALDILKASESLSSLKQVVNSTTKAWQAQSKQMSSAGDYIAAAQRKYEGLGKSIKAQETYIESLKNKQSELNGNTEKTAKEYLKFQKNIDSATTRLKSMEAQQGRAKSAMEAQRSGLVKLQSDYKTLTKASSSYTARLSAEGNKASATVVKYNGLKKSLGNLKEQYKAQATELERVANESGKTSSAYQKQKIKLDETGKSVAETRSKMKSMNSTMNKLQPTGINKIDRAVVKVKDNTGKMATKAKESFAKFKTAAMAASVGVAALGASLLSGAKQASSLQNAYVANANLMSTAGEKQADVQKAVNNMQKDGKKYSIEYGESQKVIADGYQELIKRGYSSNQALGSMKSILQASKASGDSFNDTMQVTTSTMEAFGMKSNNTATQMKNTSKVANTLAMAADATSTNFSDLGVGMSYVGTSAKQAGLSLNDTASAMGVLSNSGIEADKAGTGLRKTINSLISPTATGTDALKKYGMSISDFKDKSGNLKSVGTIFKEIGDKVPKGDQANFFHNVFGTTGQNAAAVLAQNVDQLDKVNKQVSGAYKNDYVGQLANKNMKSTQNSTKQFKEAFKAIQIELGTALMPALSKAAKGMAKAFETKNFQKGLKTFANGIGDVANALVSFVEFVGKHGKTIKTFGEILLGAFVSTKLIAGIVNIKNAIGAIKVAKAVADLDNLKGVAKGLGGLKLGAKWVGDKAVSAARKAITGVSRVGKAIKIAAQWLGAKAVAAAKLAYSGLTKTVKLTGKGFKALGLAMKANPFITITVAVIAIGTALVELYKHNKKFRTFVNGLAKDAKKFITPIVKFFTSLGKTVGKVFGALGGFAKKGWNGVKKANDAYVKADKKLWATIGKNVSKAASSMWKSTKGFFSKGWSNLKKSADTGVKNDQKAWNNFKKNTSKASSSMWKQTQKDFKGGWNNVKSATSTGINSIERVWSNLQSTTGKIAKEMMRDHPRTFKAGYKVMQDYSNTWKDVTNGHWDRLGNDTKKTAQDMTKFWKNVMGDTYDWMNKMTGGRLGDMLKSFQNGLSAISKAWSSAWTGMKNFFGDIWNDIKSLGKNALNGVIGFINGGIGGIDTVIHTFGGKASAVPKIHKLAAGTANGRLSHDTLAILNDGNDSPKTKNRELVEKKDGSMYLVKGVNTLAKLEAGDAVYNAKQTSKMLKGLLPHFGLGSGIANAVSGAVDWAGDKLGDVGSFIGDKLEAVKKFAKDPFGQLSKVFDKAIGSLAGKADLIKDMVPPAGHYIIKQGTKWFKDLFGKLNTKLDNPGGAGVQRWKDYVSKALDMLGLSSSLVNKVLKQIQTESGGNPNAMGGTDGLSDGRAMGLMQVKPGTFAANKVKGHNNIMNGFDNMLAGLNYAQKRYGKNLSFLGQGHGYANGGIIGQHQMIEIAENNKKEAVIPMDAMKSSRAWTLLKKVVDNFADSDSNTSTKPSVGGNDLDALNRKVDKLVKLFETVVGLTSNQTQTIKDTAFDKTHLYRTQSMDQTMHDAQVL